MNPKYTITGFNAEAKKGRMAAMKYCQEWQMELVNAGMVLTTELTGHKIDKALYNVRREALNKQTKDLNDCVRMVNNVK
jgi:hypothetical protein